jgi:GAF domain-containing protein
MPMSGEIREPENVAAALQMLLLGADGVESFLTDVARWAAGTIVDAFSCGVTVLAAGSMRRMGAVSDEVAARMDAIQYEVEDGPCVTCLREGVVVQIADLEADRRWPAFVELGREQRVGSSLSVPMMVGIQVVGAVNLYSRRRHGLGEDDAGRARQFADQAAGAVALAVRLAERENKARNLAIALDSRSVIDRAIGILMAQAHVDADEAFAILRDRSQHSNIKIRDIAAKVIAELTAATTTPTPGSLRSGGYGCRGGR